MKNFDRDGGMSDGVVAVMQPYFFPYAGYYRLLAAADTFVVFDDAQFTRRGRVHRCEVSGHGGRVAWLTLPLAHHPQDVAICNLRFAERARATLDARLDRVPHLRAGRGPLSDRVRELIYGPLGTPSAFVVAGLRFVAESLDLPARIVLASELSIGQGMERTSRIAAIVHAIGGRTYINASGGRALYDAATFRKHDLELRFLNPYQGRHLHMLQALVTEEPRALRNDILADCITVA